MYSSAVCKYFTLFFFPHLGVLGTKLYRKPEWVTHMEELKAQLQGNNNENVECSKINSVVTNNNKSECVSCVNRFPTDNFHTVEFKIQETAPSLNSSSSSASSSDVSDIKTCFSLKRVSTVECLQTEMDKPYAENSNNISKSNSSSDSEFEFLEAECEAAYEDDSEEFHDLDDQDLIETSVDDANGYHTLSPIQEKSEPSSNSTDSQVNDHRRFSEERNAMRMLSSSLSAVMNFPRERSHDQLLKSQTFPRYRVPSNWHYAFDKNYDPGLFPLEPREIDPSCFHQLHAADSQEELQEFLLLESECMTNDENRGLAAAFTPPESDERNSSEGENGFQKGNEKTCQFFLKK